MLYLKPPPTPLNQRSLTKGKKRGGAIEMLVYLMFSSSKFYLTSFAQFALPCRFLPIIVARR